MLGHHQAVDSPLNQDFTAAMDAVNVDLDEMRARVDSTHSIITSRQRIEVRSDTKKNA